jgi:hypothetical protein
MPTSAESTAIEASCRASHSKSQQERERDRERAVDGSKPKKYLFGE